MFIPNAIVFFGILWVLFVNEIKVILDEPKEKKSSKILKLFRKSDLDLTPDFNKMNSLVRSLDESEKRNYEYIEDTKKSTHKESKIVSEKTDDMPNIDEFFFTTLKDINEKKSKDSSHKSTNDKTREEEIKELKVKIESSSENNNDDKSGGSNIKTIKLTEKHDFF